MNKMVLPYYTLNASLLQNRDYMDITQLKLNILVQDEVELTRDLYPFISSIKNDYILSFSLSLLLEASANTDLLAKIYLLLILNNSCKEHKIIPIFSDINYAESHVNIEILKLYLSQQGITDIEFPVFDLSLNGNQIGENCSLLVQQNQYNYSQNQFVESNQNANVSIIASTDVINNLATLSDLKKNLVLYEKNNLANTSILRYYIEIEEFESERKLWKQRTLVYQDFLSLSKKVQEKEYYEVLDWYHQQYEILPLWYKQLGHVIKVITGKRSFRSLFDDKVKKYNY